MSTFTVLRQLHNIIGDALTDMERVFDENSQPSSPSSSTPTSPTSSSFNTTSSSSYSSLNTTPPASPTTAPSKSSLLGSPYSPRSPSLPFRAPNLSTGKWPASPFITAAAPSPCRPPPPTTRTPPTPLRSSMKPRTPRLDFPSPDAPYDKASAAEPLTMHPEVVSAINHIVAACGQMATIVQAPFLTLCDASMGYHLPSCMRFLEATHTVEILRDAGAAGMHIKQIAQINGTDADKLGHILRLLATHHILREVSPNVFANTRISSFMDTGKTVANILGSPEKKYEDTNGIAAFVGLCSDELFKSSAYLTEAYALTPHTKYSHAPTHAPFNFAFATDKQFFVWLEGGGGNAPRVPSKDGRTKAGLAAVPNPNALRLERFGKAMVGSSAWETPGAILNGFDWAGLAPGDIVVDVGGGIGSASMVLAEAFEHLNFVVQDRAVVVEMGRKAWETRCPELLTTGRAKFQSHDFFEPQPVTNASVFLLRVILHDWPDAFAQRILLQLREVASDSTRLIIADHVLPLACADDFQVLEQGGEDDSEATDKAEQKPEGVQGAERQLARPPLLANLGKASANAFWMDMTMQVTFNGQERTLREIVALCLSAGWKVTKVTRAPGSLFGHIVAHPVAVPPARRRARAGSGAIRTASGIPIPLGAEDQAMVERSMTPTFGSCVALPRAGTARAGRRHLSQRSDPKVPPLPMKGRMDFSPAVRRAPKGPPEVRAPVGSSRMRSGSGVGSPSPAMRTGMGSPAMRRMRSMSTVGGAKTRIDGERGSGIPRASPAPRLLS